MPAEQLTEYLQQRARDYLRGVVQYTEDDYEIIYARSDVDNEQFRNRVENIYANLQHNRPPETGKDTFGKPYVTLNIREHAVILNFRWNPTAGILVGLDPEAARQLLEFVHESMKRGFPEGELS